MGYRIFLTGYGIAEAARDELRANGCTVEVGDPRDTPADLERKLASFAPDGLIVRQGKITDAVQRAAANLKVICKHGVGTDNIDIAAATRRRIPVLFTPRANFESVAEHALGLMLSLARRIPLLDARIRKGIFDKEDYDGMELRGKTLGLIGFGRIGRRLAELVAPFEMKVLAYHPSATEEPLQPHISKVRVVDEIYPDADIISVHCPLTPDTRALIDRKTIAKMKRGVCIINTARGGIVNDTDLVEALRDARVAGAALDVFEEEPPAQDHPLLSLDNVVVTTHIAGVSDSSYRNMGLHSVRNVLAVLAGEAVDRASVLNPEVLD